ncbi:multidrug ABC transporter permease [Gordonia pseudamarae]|jgi:ABC-2 type transport system permease protein|uniref:Transport permease protein n=1 Tax=Gordonia pseudamarae TaxID=2831662 RepID=A0ABX6IGD1_9ACTN|nr:MULTISPECIES: ABC transporter permease [Gordonia]MBD0024110.1 ABC transporter permease [Gordonia sp. (in: high G+C Gram-positive bacteria)]QHN25967.1 multidrug ABC transporter permease [Gordonia pseudamarae]QHN34898.1 multidrug ABC transporter permease [Gordonia pseudamarae]
MTTDVRVMTRRGLILMLRSPMTVAMAAIMPIILLTLMSVSFGKMVLPGASVGEYVQYAAPVFTVMGVVFGALSTAIATQQDRTSGFDDRLRVSPVSAVAPFAGRIFADAARNIGSVVVVTAVAVAMGFRFEAGLSGAVLYFVLPVIFGFGIAWMMVAIATYVDSAETAVSSTNALLLLLSFLSTGFVTLHDLPGWAQPIASANPISHVAQAMRGASSGGDYAGDVVVTIVWAIGLTLVCGLLAVRGYRRRP